MNSGQDTLWPLIPEPGYHNEALDIRDRWRYESDRNPPKTFMTAIQWLERHYKEDFFLYVDTWVIHVNHFVRCVNYSGRSDSLFT